MVADELLELDDIQGGIIPGFKKDHSLIIGLFIEDVAGCKAWLKLQANEVARATDVLRFNRLYKAMRMRRGNEFGLPTIVWKSISFSASGLALLRPDDDIAGKFENKFVAGMFKKGLQDPPPAQWKMGGSAQSVPHILIVLAADRQSDLDAEMTRLVKEIGESGGGGLPALRLAGPAQAGATLPAPLTGHEHFGFKDGISQPAIRGLRSTDPTDFFDARLLAPDDPEFDRFAEPGRPLVWPGQFLIGYNRQDPTNAVRPRDPAPLKLAWQKNGSYLVYRRLQQFVHKFWEFCRDGAAALAVASGKPMTKEFFASRLVGRWPSGAPLMRAPAADDDELARDDLSNNNFGFSERTPVVRLKDGTTASSRFPAPQPDPDGRICPFVGHVRKVNPRDDSSEAGGSDDTLRRLMLRRGIPYGPPKDRTRLLEDDGVDRGLLFMAYQGAITDQFHFVTQTWANDANAPHAGEPKAGHDPLIGQNAAGRFIRMPIGDDAGHDQQLALPQEPWVLMTGGGYFFTPSISALAGPLSGGELPVAVAAGLAPLAARASEPAPQPPAAPQAAAPKPPRAPTGKKKAQAEKPAKGRKGAKRSAPKRKPGPRRNTRTRT
jgi:Dyp-type peroxidase family